jgi:hypothetical protein
VFTSRAAGDAALRGAQRHQHHVVLVVAQGAAWPLAASRPITSQLKLLDAQLLPDRVGAVPNSSRARFRRSRTPPAGALLVVLEAAARGQPSSCRW